MKVIKKLYLESDVFPCNFKSNAITNISHSFFRNFQGYTPYSDIFARVKRITDLKGKEWYWCTFIIIFFNLYQNKIVFFFNLKNTNLWHKKILIYSLKTGISYFLLNKVARHLEERTKILLPPFWLLWVTNNFLT